MKLSSDSAHHGARYQKTNPILSGVPVVQRGIRVSIGFGFLPGDQLIEFHVERVETGQEHFGKQTQGFILACRILTSRADLITPHAFHLLVSGLKLEKSSLS